MPLRAAIHPRRSLCPSSLRDYDERPCRTAGLRRKAAVLTFLDPFCKEPCREIATTAARITPAERGQGRAIIAGSSGGCALGDVSCDGEVNEPNPRRCNFRWARRSPPHWVGTRQPKDDD